MSGPVILDRCHAIQRVFDRMVTRAAAEIALEAEGQILLLLIAQAGGGHDHSRRAKTALEGLRIEKRLLHGMQISIAGQALDGGDFAALGPIGGHKAAMDGFAIKPDGAGAAIAGVAAFLHAEPSQITGKGAETLTGVWLGIEISSVDFVAHNFGLG